MGLSGGGWGEGGGGGGEAYANKIFRFLSK